VKIKNGKRSEIEEDTADEVCPTFRADAAFKVAGR
jgi:hypothetical protein